MLKPEIREQVLHIYDHLPFASKLAVQKLLYLRTILKEDQLYVSISAKSLNTSANIHCTGLFGPLRDSIPLPRSSTLLLDNVVTVARNDPSIVDWLIEKVLDRSLNYRAHLLSAFSEPEVRHFMREIEQDALEFLWNKKIFSYV